MVLIIDQQQFPQIEWHFPPNCYHLASITSKEKTRRRSTAGGEKVLVQFQSEEDHCYHHHHEARIKVKTIISLESWSKGIFMVVSGSMRSKYFNGWRNFVQTFFLPSILFSDEVNNNLPTPLVPSHNDDFQPINSTPEL